MTQQSSLLASSSEWGRPNRPSLNNAQLSRNTLHELARHSLRVIQDGQAASGALVACPTFPVYRYCWLRDGSFCAYALDRAGKPAEAAAFYRWVGATLNRYRAKAETALARFQAGQPLDDADFLNTRYTLEGTEEPKSDEWWNFQLDGYGTWLWALAEHLRRYPNSDLFHQLQPAVELTVRYLAAFWRLPNFDCWEENRHNIHPATLAAIYGGLNAAAQIYPDSPVCQAGRRTANAIRGYVKSCGVFQDALIKSVGREDVDASLLGAGVPYGLLPVRGQLMRATLRRIENELVAPDGGVYRYRQDVYYGGGEWLLLTAWLGWYYVQAGRRESARKCLQWVARQAGPSGDLPEQVAHHLLSPSHRPQWEARWGLSANPLLWSHAMYLILYTALYGEI